MSPSCSFKSTGNLIFIFALPVPVHWIASYICYVCFFLFFYYCVSKLLEASNYRVPTLILWLVLFLGKIFHKHYSLSVLHLHSTFMFMCTILFGGQF